MRQAATRGRFLQGDERLRTETGQCPSDRVGVAVVVEALCCARRIEGDHVARTHDEAGTQVRSTVVGDLARGHIRSGGADARLTGVKSEGGEVDQVLDRRMEARLGDDSSAIRVADEHHVTVQLVKGLHARERRRSADRRMDRRPAPCPGRSRAEHSTPAERSKGSTRSHTQAPCHAPCTKTTNTYPNVVNPTSLLRVPYTPICQQSPRLHGQKH